MKKIIYLIVFSTLILSIIPINVTAVNNTNISVNDFTLIDYEEKASIGNNHIMNIVYTGKTLLSKSDISYKLVGDAESIKDFNRCVDLSFDYKDNVIKFIGKVTEYGIYNVDVQPVIKDSLILSKYAWFNSSWKHKINITFDHNQIPSTLNNFPVLVNISSFECGYDDIQANGDDIMFIDEINCIKLSHEIEYFSKGGGVWDLFAWVNVTSLLHDVDKTIWLYFGNSVCGNQEDVPNTWDSDYYRVYHMNGTTDGTEYDATSNNHHSTTNTADSVTGIFGDGRDFDSGASEKLQFGDLAFPADASSQKFTISTWVNKDALSNREIIACKYDSSASYIFEIRADNYLGANVYDNAGKYTAEESRTFYPSAGSWHYIACVVDLSQPQGTAKIKLWIDGSEVVDVNSNNADVQNVRDSADQDEIGFRSSGSVCSDMILDEFRFSSIVRSDDWLATNYNMMNNATDGGFYDITGCYSNNLPVANNPIPMNGSTGVPIDYGCWQINLSDDWTNFNYTIECQDVELGTTMEWNVTNGTYEFCGGYLEEDYNWTCDTTYTIWVNITEWNWCNGNEGRTASYWFLFTTEACEEEPEEPGTNFSLTLASYDNCPCCLNFCFDYINGNGANFTFYWYIEGEVEEQFNVTLGVNNGSVCFHWNAFDYVFYNDILYFNSSLSDDNNATWYNFSLTLGSMSDCAPVTESDFMNIALSPGMLALLLWFFAIYLTLKGKTYNIVTIGSIMQITIILYIFNTGGFEIGGVYFLLISGLIFVIGVARLFRNRTSTEV